MSKILLVFLGGTMMLIVGGKRVILFQERHDMFIMSTLACQHVTQHNNISFSRGKSISLYLFTQNALGTQPNHVVAEKPLPVQEPVVEHPVYYRVAEAGNTSARYARGSLMVIGSILLLTLIAAITMLSGILH